MDRESGLSSASFDVSSELDFTPNAYEVGMFHPVYMGEVYNNRYRVLRKLGYGMSATVWLVRDMTCNRYLAMKVLSADCSIGTHASEEVEIMSHLQNADPTHPGHRHTSPLLDHFEHQGPNGVHKILVFPVMAESLQSFTRKFVTSRINKAVVKRVTKQLLQALDYAHTNGVIHTDIKADNIMFVLNDESIISSLYLPRTARWMSPLSNRAWNDCGLSFLSWPNNNRLEPWQVPCLPLAGYYLQSTAGLKDFLELDIVLADWGLAVWSDPERRCTNQIAPFELQSPELLIKAPWGDTVDIWQMGCLVANMLEGDCLFTGVDVGDGLDTSIPYDHGQRYDPEAHLIQICEALGPFPRELCDEADARTVEYYLAEDGFTRRGPLRFYPKLRERITRVDGDEKEQLLEMLFSMLNIDPVFRAPARELLQCPWLHKTVCETNARAEEVVGLSNSEQPMKQLSPPAQLLEGSTENSEHTPGNSLPILFTQRYSDGSCLSQKRRMSPSPQNIAPITLDEFASSALPIDWSDITTCFKPRCGDETFHGPSINSDGSVTDSLRSLAGTVLTISSSKRDSNSQGLNMQSTTDGSNFAGTTNITLSSYHKVNVSAEDHSTSATPKPGMPDTTPSPSCDAALSATTRIQEIDTEPEFHIAPLTSPGDRFATMDEQIDRVSLELKPHTEESKPSPPATNNLALLESPKARGFAVWQRATRAEIFYAAIWFGVQATWAAFDLVR